MPLDKARLSQIEKDKKTIKNSGYRKTGMKAVNNDKYNANPVNIEVTICVAMWCRADKSDLDVGFAYLSRGWSVECTPIKLYE